MNQMYVTHVSGFDRVKIGSIRTNLTKLRINSVLNYGTDMKLNYYKTNVDCEYFEIVFRVKFKDYNICNQLYKKEYMNDYIQFINTYSNEPKDIIDNLFNQLTNNNCDDNYTYF